MPAVAAPVAAGPLPTLAAAPPPPTGVGLPIPARVRGAGADRDRCQPSPAAAPVAPAVAKPLLDTLLSQTAVPRPAGDTLYTAPPPVACTVAISFTPGSAELPPSAT